VTSNPQILVSDEPLENISCDVLVLGAGAGSSGIELPDGAEGLQSALGDALTDPPAFSGKAGETATITPLGKVGAHTILLVGLGARSKIAPHDLRRAAATAIRRLGERSDIACALHLGAGEEGAVRATVEGALLGNYRYQGQKTEPKLSKIQRITFPGAPSPEVEKGEVVAAATILARDLMNEPASTLTPTALARRAEEVADLGGLECRVYDEKDLKEKGFGGILAVAQGSSEPPRLTVLHYKPEGAKGKVALVGKGITYDTGGYSLKPAASMENMKTDMGGAATVIGVMSALKHLRIPLEVTAFLPSCDNMISGSAIRPGDVFTQYGGRTVEVTNTDAEGRLVLADAVVLAQEGEPDAIVDIATLTGHIHIALGGRITGLFCNDPELQDELVAAGERAGETMWPMPLERGYRKDIDSDVADLKNAGPRYGGAITAALFIKEFVKDVPWAHLDIAGTGRSDTARDELSKGGTGVGIRTLLEWLEARSN
jgi:leucyl aminopeptidase